MFYLYVAHLDIPNIAAEELNHFVLDKYFISYFIQNDVFNKVILISQKKNITYIKQQEQ